MQRRVRKGEDGRWDRKEKKGKEESNRKIVG